MSEIKRLGGLPEHKRKGGGFQTGYEVYGADGIAPTLLSHGGGYGIMVVEDKIRQIGNFVEREGGRKNPSCGRVYDTNGISPTLNTMQGGGRAPHIVAMRGKKSRLSEFKGSRRKDRAEAGDEDGRKGNSFSERVYRSEKISPAVTSSFRPSYETSYRIRKLTPRECFRLMGVSDADAGKMLAVNSNSQCYKQAGNSIVVPVLEAIFRNLNIKGVKTWSEAKGDKRNV